MMLRAIFLTLLCGLQVLNAVDLPQCRAGGRCVIIIHRSALLAMSLTFLQQPINDINIKFGYDIVIPMFQMQLHPPAGTMHAELCVCID